jgi:TolB-like protein
VQGYRQQNIELRTLSQHLSVHAVVLGEMIRLDDKIFLHVELIDVSNGIQRWGTSFKRLYSEIARNPERLADRIVQQIHYALGSESEDKRDSAGDEHAS